MMATAAVLLLAACSSLPLPAEVDLRQHMGDATDGSVEVPIGAGPETDIDTTLPEEVGECFDLTGESYPVTVESAQLHWNVDVAYHGPELSGRVQARLYVAGSDDDLFHASNTLGPTVTVNLDRTTTRFAGTATLGPSQLEAIDDREVCWGVRVTGDDVGAEESGTATIDYDVRDLRLKIRFSVI